MVSMSVSLSHTHRISTILIPLLIALSPTLKGILENLEAKHSGLEQAEKALKGNGCLRRNPIETIVSIIYHHHT